MEEGQLHELCEAEGIELNDTLKSALLTAENTQDSMFILGKAGTGKSVFVDLFTRVSRKDYVLLAPTGISAVNIGGQTIHSFFKFSTDLKNGYIETNEKTEKLVRSCDVIIIDEISMVRQDLFQAIDIALKKYTKEPYKLFGGKQIIIIGDILQLPPVLVPNEKEVYFKTFNSPWFFESKACNKFKLFNFEKVYRQNADETEFKEVLNRIREGHQTQNDLNFLNKNVKPKVNLRDTITVVTTNSKADFINDERLAMLETEARFFNAKITGHFPEKYFPTAEVLHLKIGAQVMNLRNNANEGIYNGSIGKVVDFISTDDGMAVIVCQFPGVGEVKISPVTYENTEYASEGKDDESSVKKNITGTFKQFPLKVAYAITVHKAQGQSFNSAKIDLSSGTFAPGQAYVALSRCRSFKGMVLERPIMMRDIIVDKEVVRFLHSIEGKTEIDRGAEVTNDLADVFSVTN